MSFKRENLLDIVWREIPRAIDPIEKLTWDEIKKSALLEDVTYIYESLGGKGDLSRLKAPDWHIELDGNIVLQLDEQLHFNRFRNLTLRSAIYREDQGFSVQKFRTYSRKKEDECLKTGTQAKYWTTPFAEKHFGEGARQGDLKGGGAPAWKLLAFLDYWQDLTAALKPVKVIRISIWDELMLGGKLVSINDILTNPAEKEAEALVSYLKRRVQPVK
ncbi:hypothetical protein V6R21_06695 [Limibacter armeniacum]|uniref:DUF7255 family protein n=1 Tax=Limibacter armeniacum TaxID=466084 RepID=UPI002FE69272